MKKKRKQEKEQKIATSVVFGIIYRHVKGMRKLNIVVVISKQMSWLVDQKITNNKWFCKWKMCTNKISNIRIVLDAKLDKAGLFLCISAFLDFM